MLFIHISQYSKVKEQFLDYEEGRFLLKCFWYCETLLNEHSPKVFSQLHNSSLCQSILFNLPMVDIFEYFMWIAQSKILDVSKQMPWWFYCFYAVMMFLPCRKHPVGILLPIFAAILVPFVKSTVRYVKDLGIVKPQTWS